MAGNPVLSHNTPWRNARLRDIMSNGVWAVNHLQQFFENLSEKREHDYVRIARIWFTLPLATRTADEPRATALRQQMLVDPAVELRGPIPIKLEMLQDELESFSAASKQFDGEREESVSEYDARAHVQKHNKKMIQVREIFRTFEALHRHLYPELVKAYAHVQELAKEAGADCIPLRLDSAQDPSRYNEIVTWIREQTWFNANKDYTIRTALAFMLGPLHKFGDQRGLEPEAEHSEYVHTDTAFIELILRDDLRFIHPSLYLE